MQQHRKPPSCISGVSIHGTHSIVGSPPLSLSLSPAEGCAVRSTPPAPRAAVVTPSSLYALCEWRDALVLLRSSPHTERAERETEDASAQWEHCPESLRKETYVISGCMKTPNAARPYTAIPVSSSCVVYISSLIIPA